MWLFFKNGIKQLLKEKIQFAIYIILIALAVVFFSVFGIASSTLVQSSNTFANEFQQYDYSYKYTSTDYASNDTATMTPWFAFDTDLVTNHGTDGENESNINYFPSLTIGDNGVLKAYQFNYDESDYNYETSIISIGAMGEQWVNFNFGDVESNPNIVKDMDPSRIVNKFDEEKIYSVVRSGEFGDFYRFNFENASFQKSLIGRIYQKFDFVNTDYNSATDEAKTAATNIFKYMLYINNSSITDIVKSFIMYKFNETTDKTNINQVIEDYINGDGSVRSIENTDALKTTLSGRVGWIDSSSNNYVIAPDFLGKEDSKLLPGEDESAADRNITELKKYGSYFVKNYEGIDILSTVINSNHEYTFENEIFSNSYLFNAYNLLVSELSNFKTVNLSQTIMWGIGGVKYRFISAFYDKTNPDGTQLGQWYQPDMVNVFDQVNESERSNFLEGTFAVTAGYAKSQNWELGQAYSIIPSDPDNEVTFDATVGDSLNTYPTIYDEDILTDKDTQAIFYLNNVDFGNYFGDDTKINSNQFQDTSRIFMKHINDKNSDMEFDKDIYQLYLANNLTSLGDVQTKINNMSSDTNISDVEANNSASNIQAYKDTTIVNMRSSLLPKAAKMFMWISISLTVVFIAVIVFVVYNIVRKFLQSQRSQLGNLKSLGVRKTKLITNFVIYMLFPVLFIVPIGWGVSISLETVVMNIFNTYFNISPVIPIGWQFLLIEWVAAFAIIGFVVWYLAWRTIRKEPLILMNPNTEMTKVSWINRVSSKLHVKKFTTRMRLTILTTSFKNIISYFCVFLIAGLILTVSLVVPSTIKGMTSEYYANVNYENGYEYSGVYSNVPTTRYGFYNISNTSEEDRGMDEALASSINTYFKVNGEDGSENYTSLFDNRDQDAFWNENSAVNLFDQTFYNNLLTINGVNFSIDTFDKLLDRMSAVSAEAKTTVSASVNTLACSVVPKLFGQPVIELDGTDDQYDSCISQVSSNLIPSTVKELWANDENEKKLFSLDFNKISYDANQDQLYTRVEGYVGDNPSTQIDSYIYGIDKNSRNQNLNLANTENFLDDSTTSKIIPVTVNKKMTLRGYKKGDTIPFSSFDNKIYLGDPKKDGVVLTPEMWSYENKDANGNVTYSNNLFDGSVDLNHMTYNENEQYYLDTDGTIKPYNLIQNVVLKLPKDFDKKIKDTNAAYLALKNHAVEVDADGNFIIHPFDTRVYDENDQPEPIGIDSLSDENVSYTWWGLATNGVDIDTSQNDDDDDNINAMLTADNDGIIKADKILYKNETPVKTSYTLKIVGIQDLYDGYSIYMSQSNANRILGLQNPEKTLTFANGDKANIWSNAKLSKDDFINDQMRRMILHADGGDNSIYGMGKGTIAPSINKANYVASTKSVINKLVVSVYTICMIFVVIAIVTALIVIYLITDLSIGRFKRFMSLMRVQGYQMREINSIIIWLFAPTAIVATILAEFVIYLVIQFAVPAILISLNIAVPLHVNIIMIVVTFLISALIFTVAYLYVLSSIKRVRLSTLLG
jgi:putative ABC transport system permease protein